MTSACGPILVRRTLPVVCDREGGVVSARLRMLWGAGVITLC